MNPFVRFIFITLAAAVAVNLAFVLFANNRSQARKNEEQAQRRSQLGALVELANSRVRRADLIVVNQTTEWKKEPVTSTLLIRQYKSFMSQEKPLPIRRFEISGDVLNVDGVILAFDPLFGDKDEDLKVLAGRTLGYFARFYGKDAVPQRPQPDDRFTLFPPADVPQLTQLYSPLPAGVEANLKYPADELPSPFEMRIWQILWRSIGEPPRDTATASGLETNSRGMTVRWLKPESRIVRQQHVYSVLLGIDGSITIEEDRTSSISGLAEEMVNQMAHQENPQQFIGK